MKNRQFRQQVTKMKTLKISHRNEDTSLPEWQKGQWDAQGRMCTGPSSCHLSILINTSEKHQGGLRVPLWKRVQGENAVRTSITAHSSDTLWIVRARAPWGRWGGNAG